MIGTKSIVQRKREFSGMTTEERIKYMIERRK